MTGDEREALQQPISNAARTLYLLGLRPDHDPSSGYSAPIHYKTLLTLVNDAHFQVKLGRDINELLGELITAGLVALNESQSLEQSLNGQQVMLPLAQSPKDAFQQTHGNWHAMHREWQPEDSVFEDLATLVGLIDKAYSEHELGEFIAYWLGRPQMQFSPFQWTQKFVFQLRQKRLAYGAPRQQVGLQTVTTQAGIEVDDNARQLMEKYRKKEN
ncbi:flavodoxin [Aestuariibacter halophilus]|uniref:Flavodoxin n=1 Tax=Fluctibacter halophilus TaxID=226011 RepID=A0ABS8G8M6_9ALTE|nr:DnaT-like ssDNA-binding domain-containing protein [Aestuariibacter halophilus]MCC2616932.1 flavodoxin [Aestuariibacter halophilus]